MTETTILHSDLNAFYASVEMNEHPELRGKMVAVCGSTENRHGIVLAKSYSAKEKGVETGMANWEAMRNCPGLICVEPHYDLYLRYSRLTRAIYRRYTDLVEPFGMDENWLDVTGSVSLLGKAQSIAEDIRKTVKEELGLTVSIGIANSKVFAKLGSDMKKPDAITDLTGERWREKIWPLPVSALLYAGRETTKKLMRLNILTIGDLARADGEMVRGHLGKNGLMLWGFANGLDSSRVMPHDFVAPIKSVGHGTTCVVDLGSEYEVWLVLYELAQDIGHRLRESGLMAKGVQLSIKDMDLSSRPHQAQLAYPTQSPLEIAQAAFALFRERYFWEKPVRALTVRGINLIPENQPVQIDLFEGYTRRDRQKTLDDTIEEIRRRFGSRAIYAAALMGDLKMAKDKCEMVIMPGLMYR
ncbi:MAG: DNA polymerase IV [Clostridia bacterium]